jgi:hypothetical protein
MKVTASSPAASTLAARARELGRQHAAAGIAPFGGADYVRWDAESADLMTALRETAPTMEGNQPERLAAIEAYCDALTSDAVVVTVQAPALRLSPERLREYDAALEEQAARWGLPPLDGAR